MYLAQASAPPGVLGPPVEPLDAFVLLDSSEDPHPGPIEAKKEETRNVKKRRPPRFIGPTIGRGHRAKQDERVM